VFCYAAPVKMEMSAELDEGKSAEVMVRSSWFG
jgi:hypothetical protein